MNVRTKAITEKSMASLSFMKNMGKIYTIYEQMEPEAIHKNPGSLSNTEKYL